MRSYEYDGAEGRFTLTETGEVEEVAEEEEEAAVPESASPV